MVILHTETLKSWGGQQNRVLMEAAELNKRGHRAVVACNRGSVLANKLKQAGIKVYEENMAKQAHLKTVPSLMKIIKEEKVDIVCTHSSVDSWAGGMAAKLTGRRLVRFRHNLYPIGRDPLTKFIYAIPDRIVAISSAISGVLAGCGVNRSKMTVICSSVNLKKFNPDTKGLREELNIPEHMPVIGNTSTFTELKGQKYLLQAFNSISRKTPCILMFAGRLDERSRGRHLSYVAPEFRDRVIFLGHRDDIPAVLQTIDIFVFPSYLEGLGTALLEAMTMGKTVAVSDIPTFRDFVEEGRDGLFFKVKSPEDISEKVLLLLQDMKLRQELGGNARAAALEKFNVDRMMDVTEKLYREVLHGAV